ncbi:MAG: hypothetical protein WC242_03530 [Candidatus Paceibacterota bacterium]|jgi:hypothetical protein
MKYKDALFLFFRVIFGCLVAGSMFIVSTMFFETQFTPVVILPIALWLGFILCMLTFPETNNWLQVSCRIGYVTFMALVVTVTPHSALTGAILSVLAVMCFTVHSWFKRKHITHIRFVEKLFG